MPLLVDKQRDYLAFIRNLQRLVKFVLVYVKGDDPGPGFRVFFLAAHGRVFPPAEDEILTFGDGQAIPPEVEIRVLQSLSERHPCVNFFLLLGFEGNKQQVDLSGQVLRQVHFGLIEAIRCDRGENRRLVLLAVLRSKGKRQYKSAERKPG